MVSCTGEVIGGQDIQSRAILTDTKLWRGPIQYNCKTGSLVESDTGEILASWYGGSGKDKENTGLWIATCVRGMIWSAPVCVFRKEGYNVWNPVFFKSNTGKISLYFRIYQPEGDDTHRYVRKFTYLVMDYDPGLKRWNEPKELLPTITGPTKCSPLVLKDGRWLFPTSEPLENENHRSWSLLTEDEGLSWKRFGADLASRWARANDGTRACADSRKCGPNFLA